MRIVWSLFVIAMIGLCLPGLANASDGFEDVAKLAKTGVAEETLIQYVKTSPVAFDLTVDEILYLTDLGVSPKAISAIVEHGKDIRAGKQPETITETVLENKTTEVSTKALDQDAEIAAATTTTAITQESDSKSAGPVAEVDGTQTDATQTENGGKLIFTSPLSSAVLTEQESVTETVAETVPATAQPEGEVTTETFYEALTPYGTWIKIDENWCWQPSVTVSDPEWQPYCDRGHWASTDCGWFWQSDYSWGWAPFHYGRWKRCAGYGWLWTPDTCWSPAWVSWRECDSYYGWAPLPPSCGYDVNVGLQFCGRHVDAGCDFGLSFGDFCFVGSDHFCDFSLRRHRIPRHECGTIYNRSALIHNNVTYVNKRVVVNGPQVDRVQKFAGRDIPKLKIADAHIGAGQSLIRTTHVDKNNGVINVYKPEIKKGNLTPADVAKKQLASHVTTTKISADPKVLASSQKADEIRAKQLAAQESRKQAAENLQRSKLQNTVLKNSELQQQKLQSALKQEQDSKRKAELASKLEAQRLQAQNVLKQKQELDNKAAEARKHTLELNQQRDQALKQKAAVDAAQKQTQLKAQQDAAQKQAQLAAQQKAQQLAAQKAQQLEAQKHAQLGAQQKAQQEAAQRQAQLKAQQDAAAQKQAQLQAQKAQQLEAQKQAQSAAQQKAQQDAAQRQAQLAAQQKAQQDAAAQKQAQLQTQKAQQAQQQAARQAQIEAQKQAQQLKQLQNNNLFQNAVSNDDQNRRRRR